MKNLTLLALMLTFNVQLLTFNCFAQASNQPGAGNCLNYNGTTNYMEFLNPNGLPIGGSARSIEAWIFNDPAGCGGTVVAYGDGFGGNQDFIFLIDNVSGPNRYIYTDGINGANNIAVPAAQIPPLNAWSHIAFIVDNSNNWSYYLNGQLQSTSTFPVALNTSTPTNLRFGKRSDYQPDPICTSRNFPFGGQLDEVRIWNTARTQTEIRNNMCKKLIGNEVGLVGYWRFDEGIDNTCSGGQDACDASGNGNNGTKY